MTKSPSYEWVSGFVPGKLADAEKCARRILDIWDRQQRIDPQDIVDDARNANSPFKAIIFHDPDNIAVWKWRKELAKGILRSIEILTYTPNGVIRNRLVEHIKIINYSETKKLTGYRTYVPLNVIRKDATLIDALLNSIDLAIDDWKLKRKDLMELLSIDRSKTYLLKQRDEKVLGIINDRA